MLVTIKKSSEIKAVFSGTSDIFSAANRYMVMYARKTGLLKNRIGLVVSRKVGTAVVRNKFRRRLKEILRAYFTAHGSVNREDVIDIVVVARKEASTASFSELYTDVFRLIVKINAKMGPKSG